MRYGDRTSDCVMKSSAPVFFGRLKLKNGEADNEQGNSNTRCIPTELG